MRLKYASLLAACGLVLSAAPSAADVTWQGAFVVTNLVGSAAAQAKCTTPVDATKAVHKGDIFRVVVRPKNVDINGPDTKLAISDGTRLFHMTLPAGAMPSGTAGVLGIDENAVPQLTSTTYSGFTQAPAAITASDLKATLKGRITKFMGLAGCTIDFDSALALRP